MGLLCRKGNYGDKTFTWANYHCTFPFDIKCVGFFPLAILSYPQEFDVFSEKKKKIYIYLYLKTGLAKTHLQIVLISYTYMQESAKLATYEKYNKPALQRLQLC